MAATAEFAPFLGMASIAVSNIQDYTEQLSREQKLKNYKIFMRIVEIAMKDSKQFQNDAQIEEFADKIFTKLVELKFFEHLEESFMHTNKDTWLKHDVATARQVAGSTLYVSHEPFLFKHYRDIQDVSGIPLKDQKDLKSSANKDVQNVIKYMISHMSNFGVIEDETDVKVIVNKIVSYFSTNAISLEFSQKVAIKIYEALTDLGANKWHFDEEKQSLMIFQIKQFLRNEEASPGQETLLARLMKNPHHLKLLYRKISAEVKVKEDPDMFKTHQEAPGVMQKLHAAAEQLNLTQPVKKLEFQDDFINNNEAIKKFLSKVYISISEQRKWADKMFNCMKNGEPGYHEFGKILQECNRLGISLDLTDENGNTPLILACKAFDTKMVEHILFYESGRATIGLSNNKGAVAISPVVTIINQDGSKTLKAQKKEIIESLIKNGADVNTKIASYPILSIAIQHQLNEIVDLLLDHPEIDIHAWDRNFLRPIHLAADSENFYAQAKLFKMGAEVGHTVKMKATGPEKEELSISTSPLHMILLRSTNFEEIDSAIERATIHEINDLIEGVGSNVLHINFAMQERREIFYHLLKHPKVKIHQLDHGFNLLHKAIMSRDPEAAEMILQASALKEQKIDISQKNEFSNSPLHLICLSLTKLVAGKYLTLYGNATDIQKADGLKYDMFKELLWKLIQDGADVNAPFPKGTSATRKMTDKSEAVHKAVTITEDLSGNHLLHFAIKFGYKDIFDLLIDHKGVQFDARDENGRTIVHLAVQHSSIGMIEKIAEKFKDQKEFINAVDAKGKTALHIALQDSDFSIARKLIDLGADLNIADVNGVRPLDDLIEAYGHRMFVLNKKKLGPVETELLSKYLYEDAIDMVEHISNEKSFKLQEINKDDRTYLHNSSSYDALMISKILLKKGAAICPDNVGRTPIFNAAERGDIILIKKLLEKNSTLLEHQNLDLETPLIAALKNDHEAVARFLIEHGADYSTPRNGFYPIHHAIINKMSNQFIESMFEGIEDVKTYLIQDSCMGANIINYVMMYGDHELIEFVQSKCLQYMKPGFMEDNKEYNIYFAALGGNLDYFSMLTEEEIAGYIDTPIRLDDNYPSQKLADLAFTGYLRDRKKLTEKGIDAEKINQMLKHYSDLLKKVYHHQMDLVSHLASEILDFATVNKDSYLCQMFSEKGLSATNAHNVQEIAIEFPSFFTLTEVHTQALLGHDIDPGA